MLGFLGKTHLGRATVDQFQHVYPCSPTPAAENALQLEGQEPNRPLLYFDKGNMAVVGKNFAILERGGFARAGSPHGSFGYSCI
jgi:hypothetical protein